MRRNGRCRSGSWPPPLSSLFSPFPILLPFAVLYLRPRTPVFPLARRVRRVGPGSRAAGPPWRSGVAAGWALLGGSGCRGLARPRAAPGRAPLSTGTYLALAALPAGRPVLGVRRLVGAPRPVPVGAFALDGRRFWARHAVTLGAGRVEDRGAGRAGLGRMCRRGAGLRFPRSSPPLTQGADRAARQASRTV